VPFALWDAASLWQQGVLFHFRTAYRPEALTVFAPFAAHTDVAPTRVWNIAAGLVATTVTMIACRRMPVLLGYLWVVATTTFAMYLFGSKAYVNYYYFVGGLLLFLVCERIRVAVVPALSESQ
jgi:hypothetical protein